ncbi:MAG TPA: von Willebrand factor type A domain-containing protein [Tepidisphaeraceae bacterium]|nr:von Willebrand factor type A domain-containing protein [Tepidisphaeraceae bacterium]
MRSETDEMNLTAYALGELEGAQRAVVEARLAVSPQDRQYVEDMRTAAHTVADELSREPVSGLDAIHYAAIELRLRKESGFSRPVNRREIVRGRIGFIATLAAAIAVICGAVGAVLLTLSHRTDLAVQAPVINSQQKSVLIPFERINVGESHAGGGGSGRLGSGASPFVNVSDKPVSNFAMNTDSGSYEDLRKALMGGHLPSRDSIKIEGLINAFNYDYPAPTGAAPFGASIEIGPCPWQGAHQLARVMVKAKDGAGTLAEDVRTEVSFNPAAVKSWRLLGYDDLPGGPSAGENVGAGHAVTALYEVVPADPPKATSQPAIPESNVLTLKVRFHNPGDKNEQTLQFVGTEPDEEQPISADFQFAAAVAEFGMVIRQSPDRGNASVKSVMELAEANRGPDLSGQRKQFLELVQHAQPLLG